MSERLFKFNEITYSFICINDSAFTMIRALKQFLLKIKNPRYHNANITNSVHDKKSVMPAQAGNHLWFGTVARWDNSLTYNENHIISIAQRRLYGVYQRVEG